MRRSTFFLETPAFAGADLAVTVACDGRSSAGGLVPYPRPGCRSVPGGMGEVYRGATPAQARRRDQGPAADVTSDPDRLARFEREAQLLASLNHPHIGAIYGLEGSMAGRRWFSSSSRARHSPTDSRRGRRPLAEALAIARQIAEALEAAHEKGSSIAT